MTLPESNLIALGSLLQQFNSTYAGGGSNFSNLIAIGTQLYNLTDVVTEYPNSSAAFKAYLVNLNIYINTFIAGLPTPVTLSN